MKHSLSRLTALGIGVGFIGVMETALSAESGQPGARSGSPAVEEIIVTARKREERAIDTPVAIAALTEEEVERYNTRDLAELTTRIPGVSISHAAGGGAGGNMTIRGVGNLAVDYGADQPVALVLDGMSFTRGHVLDTGFFDVGGVQVLKGPQALFYGKNSPAGVIAVTSRTPTPGDEIEYFGRIGYEFVTEDPVLEAGISFPLGETVAMRLAGRYQNMQGGYLDNSARPLNVGDAQLTLAPGVTAPMYPTTPGLMSRGASYDEFPAQDQQVLRLTTVWQPNDSFKATLKNFYSYSQQNDAGNTILYACADGVGGNPYYLSAPDPTQVCTSSPRLRRNGALPPAQIVDSHIHLNSSDNFFNKLTNNIETLEMVWDFNDLTFTSVTGYWDYRHREYTNYDYTSYAVVVSKQGESGESFTQEFRLQSGFDGPVNFMVGLFYETTERDLDAPVQIFPELFTDFADQAPRVAPGTPYNGTYINYHQHWDNNIDSYSMFGSIDFAVNEQWTVTGGARFTKEERDSVGGNIFENSSILNFSPAGVVYRPEDDSDNVSPELTVSYRPTDNMMIYTAYKTGFQSAGISNPGTVPDLRSLSAADQNDALVFDESVVKGFEVGLKGYFFDQQLSADIIVYRYKYEDLQVGIFNPVTTTFTIQNAAEAINQGIDFTSIFQATDELQLRVAAQYNDLEFESFEDAGCNAIDDARPVNTLPATGPGCHVGPNGNKIQDLSGEQYGGPPFQANVGVSYETNLFSNWGMELTADAIYHSEGQEALRQRGTDIPQRTVLNLAARLYQGEGPWNVSLICSNCLDEIYVTGIGNKPLAKTGDLTGFVAPPRLVTLQLTYEVQ